ncbi:MAG: FAD binding domain-containing protein, partial [Gaiellales bacterium]
PLYKRPTRGRFVAVADIDELKQVEHGADEVSIGASVTHRGLAGLGGDLAVLSEAARGTPRAVGNVATLAGNICARPYPAADLVPALLSLDAVVEVASVSGRARVPVTDFEPAPGQLVTRAIVARRPRARSAYERLTVRRGGEESVASVALWVELDADGTVCEARVAFGSVEERSRRCREAETLLTGGPLLESRAQEAGRAAAGALAAIDAPDAPAWYRLRVLPTLLGRAAARLVSPESP